MCVCVCVCLCLSVCDTERMFNCVCVRPLVSVCVSPSECLYVCMCVCVCVCVCACSQPVRRTGRGRQIIVMAAPAVPQIWCEEESEGGRRKKKNLAVWVLNGWCFPETGMSERTSGAQRVRTHTHTLPHSQHTLTQTESKVQCWNRNQANPRRRQQTAEVVFLENKHTCFRCTHV